MAVVNGTAGDDELYGGDDADTVSGLAGDDALQGGAGDDVLNGGDGNDLLTGEQGSDRLNGGAGIDTADYLRQNTISTGVGVNLLTGAASGAAGGDTFVSIENVRGSNFNDTLTGNDGSNTLSGAAGDDNLRGSLGNDILSGGAGADDLNGGDGIDVANYGDGTARVSINWLNGEFGGFASGDTLTAIENIYGTDFDDYIFANNSANELRGGLGDDQLRGAGGDDMLNGGVGADDLVGGTGADSLSGGDGNDTLEGSDGADALNGGAGSDAASYSGSDAEVTVDLAAGTGSGGDAEGDTYTSIESLTGSAFADTLYGSAGANALAGGAGDDMLYGDAGADVLNGGAGIDAAGYFQSDVAVTVDLTAGTGTGGHAEGDTLSNIENLGGSRFNDTLSGNAGANAINGGGGDDTVAGAAGNDTLYGGNSTDRIDGGDGWDTLLGEAGDDRLAGGAGGDILRGGDGADHLAGGAGYDIASYWYSTAGVTINLETQVNTGGEAQGDTIDDDVETINGSNHDDAMTGNALANVLVGFDGADVLSGAGGDDVLRGGDGADTLNGGAGGDYFSYTAVSDSTAAAADTIQDFEAWDAIWLQSIDADGNAANGDTAFSFIGTGAFSGTAGQLRYEIAGDTTTVSADVDGDSAADIVIHLTGAITLQASEFML
ncbi:hypothetical protein FFK22_032535 [Mycobacterium sp. KBS0706]|uniref:calcium-binding protein n=1 Tax=Mycobacterium sp. KBS0706 TaxID=2578109 RepID=UPI00117BEC07|nr:calcium-binding protein [Mycobacterium sp. KBS0706]TSD84456.1 hypothetical protein FFK22_032535 [Mycobacterium sp. KBS0706]